MISKKERREILKRLMDTPIGANKRFLVKCGPDDYAGFNTRHQANAYVAMMKAGSDRLKAPACSKMNWSIIDRG